MLLVGDLAVQHGVCLCAAKGLMLLKLVLLLAGLQERA